ncbi:hypothetical protein Pint_20908 [Pistacia integerrima]|uniref:Uncharacterized protein n=1 Tax=Pistacia integerrima TaxID=434235 RepID=A0ACC0XEX4_9ROSI|nr:hypothetical protein Pint_20908 [Pistacia integerrima]
MENWFIILISLCVAALIKALFNLLYPTKTSNYKLPPSPSPFFMITKFRYYRKSLLEFESFVRSLHSKLGPILTLQFDSYPLIFITDRFLAHQALIQNGAVFADRPPPTPISRIISSNQHISSAVYGPTWRLLRRNLTGKILHPSSVKSYSHACKWLLRTLLDCLSSQSKSGNSVQVVDHFQYAMFCLLVFMCFGDRLDQKKIKEVEDAHRQLVLNLNRFHIFSVLPRLTKILFHKRWQQFLRIRQRQYDSLMPLIKKRRKVKEERLKVNDDYVLAYVDTLFDLELPEEKRKLDEKEIMSLCSEFIAAGTDTAAAALQWVLANLVKYPHIQEKLFTEIKGVIGDSKMPYMKAVILESLRRHPASHLGVPHTVTEDVVLNGFLIPKKASIYFMVADMGWDTKAWDDPMEFKPERFLNKGEVFDITGSREIKMMPFGVGRRICPGLNLARLHLEYVVANLVWWYGWKSVDGSDLNMEENHEFTGTMKYPLEAHLYPRFE